MTGIHDQSIAFAIPSASLPFGASRTPAHFQGLQQDTISLREDLSACSNSTKPAVICTATSFLALLASKSNRRKRCNKKRAQGATNVQASASDQSDAVKETGSESSAPKPASAPAPAASLDTAAARAKSLSGKQWAEDKLTFDPSKEAGVTAPFGFFDPLGFCPSGEERKFRKLRISEMKHGRVAMLASIGLVAQHYIRLPGGIFDEVPNGIYVLLNPTGVVGLGAVMFVSLVLEFALWAQDPDKEIGDFGDPLGFKALSMGLDMREMRNREINNGRFAMFATVGILLAEGASGKDAVEQLLP